MIIPRYRLDWLLNETCLLILWCLFIALRKRGRRSGLGFRGFRWSTTFAPAILVNDTYCRCCRILLKKSISSKVYRVCLTSEAVGFETQAWKMFGSSYGIRYKGTEKVTLSLETWKLYRTNYEATVGYLI